MFAGSRAFVPLLLIALLGVGCADQRVPRADDEAMLLYRDCMNGMPQSWDATLPESSFSNQATRQSVNAATASSAEAKRLSECSQLAGWEEK